MRLRIRTLLLTAALLINVTTPASACCLFNPFRALFGCGCYPGYGYGQNPGYAAPGYGCYQPSYPGLMSPCGPCAAPCPLVELFRMPACLPMPAIFQQCLDPCGMQQCGPPMMPAPMVQYQPMPVQQQYFSAPMMQAPAMDMGCDGGCSGETAMPGMAPQMQMMAPQAMSMSGMASDEGCCDNDSAMAYGTGLQNWNTAPVMAWSPQGPYPGAGFPVRSYHSSLPPTGYGLFTRPRVARREARRMEHQFRRMNHHQAYPQMGYPNAGLMPAPYSYPQSMQPMYSQPYMGQTGYPQAQSYANQPMPMTTQWAPQTYSTQSFSTMPTTMMHSTPAPMPSAWSAPEMNSTMMPSGLRLQETLWEIMKSQQALRRWPRWCRIRSGEFHHS